jgi:beta-mannosidase
MARLLSCSATVTEALDAHWECTGTPAGAARCPSDLSGDCTWYPAIVPGTFAAALRAAGAWNGQPPLELDQMDVWYRVSFVGDAEEELCFEGLATIADIWLNGVHVLHSDNMFRPCRIKFDLAGSNDLYICFRSLLGWLGQQKGRARWRTRIATPPTLRFARATLLGRMPGWCPIVHPVGPWRPVLRRRRTGTFTVSAVHARASLDDGNGRLVLRCGTDGDVPANVEGVVTVGDHAGRIDRISANELEGDIVIPCIAPWWPHSHGDPRLYSLTLQLGDVTCDLGQVGFRSVAAHRDADGMGFCVRVNDAPIFCRGACWTTPDIVALPGDATRYRPWLVELRDAGMNMVRVSGTMVYEADDFYTLCDQLGLLVWQDAMLANFDYPATAAFRSSLAAELRDFLDRTQLNPSLAVFCGGSEVLQQAAMFGLATDRIDDTLYRSIIPDVVHRTRADLVYVPNSPCGGDLAFQPNAGVAHYYGVGAYLRPLNDARLAGVRFASECLALANVPCERTVEALHVSSTTDARWKQAVPRDAGAGWDFDDVRDHYLAILFGQDPLQLRYADFSRYLELSRAVSCILMEEVFNEWRRVGSVCRGGLVWQWKDVAPGAGWGVIDAFGRRKAPWYALQRACRSRQVILSDEGLNGLTVHVLNEAASHLHAVLHIACLKDGAVPVREAEQSISVGPRSAITFSSAALLSGFFDINYAYRFGPRVHDATVVTLRDAASGELIADACHFPDIGTCERRDIGLEAEVHRDERGWSLHLRSRHLARFLHIDDAAFTAQESWLHLPPGRARRIALRADTDQSVAPQGEITALNMDRTVRYAGSA